MVGEVRPGADFYDYDDKYGDGAELLIPAPIPQPVSDELRDLAVQGLRRPAVRGHGPGRLLLGGGRPGSVDQRGQHHPGLHAHLAVPAAVGATGLPYAKLIDELVALALERHERRSRFCTER